MYILGISAFYHDSAAVLINDGELICAIEEERFSRVKHDNSFPFKAIDFCLKKLPKGIKDINYIAYYEKPLLKFERILETFVATYPFSLKPFLKGIPEWLDQKIKVEQIIRKKIEFKGKLFFVPHHFSHAAATYYTTGFTKSAILTIDGVGEYQTTGLWLGEKDKITPLQTINFPDSLGLLYSTVTAFLGFKINEDEYKLMGLSAYGKPNYIDKIYKLISVKDDGSFKLNLKYFGFRSEFKMWNKEFEKLFGKPRSANDPITKRDKDLASSIQKVTEEIYFKILNHLYDITKSKNLCLSGGVALNALANGMIYQKSPFRHVAVLGAASDSGTALGAGLYVYSQILGQKNNLPVNNLYLGSEFSDEEIEKSLKDLLVKYHRFKNEEELITKTAKLISLDKIVGFFEGQMEFGPRALGARSILANPKPRFMKEKVNIIKRREQFRPFAGSVLQERVQDLFEVPENNHYSPFMNFCFQVKKEKQSEIAAIVHQDKSCRIQTVCKDNGIYYKLIKKFYEITGVPCILNTSFNLKGEPIVETPKQAIEDFLKTKMDYLVIGSYLCSKS